MRLRAPVVAQVEPAANRARVLRPGPIVAALRVPVEMEVRSARRETVREQMARAKEEQQARKEYRARAECEGQLKLEALREAGKQGGLRRRREEGDRKVGVAGGRGGRNDDCRERGFVVDDRTRKVERCRDQRVV